MNIESLKLETERNGTVVNSGKQENHFSVTLIYNTTNDIMYLDAVGVFNGWNVKSIDINVDGLRPNRKPDYSSTFTSNIDGKQISVCHWENMTNIEISKLTKI
jgi:hypothetical protein